MTDTKTQQLLYRLEVRERQIDAMRRINEALVSRDDLDTLLRETLRVSLETVEADAGSLLLYDKERKKLVFRYVVGKTELVGQEIDPEEDIQGKASTVFRSGISLLTKNTTGDLHDIRFDNVTGYRTENMVTVALKRAGGEPIGVMQALNKRNGAFDFVDCELLEIVSSLAATSIVNASLAKEAQLAAVARAVGDLSHDIKNALTPIETTIDTIVETFLVPMYADLDVLIAQWSKDRPEMATALKEVINPLQEWYPEIQAAVKDACGDIREMVSEITDYLKGAQATHKEISNLQSVVEERLKRLKCVAEDRRVTLSMEGLESVPPFAFDRRLLGRAIFNLVNNALGAISDAVKKGVLELRPFHIRVRASARLEGVFPEGNYCLIEVQDDGPGMAARVRESLFTPQTISTTPGGTGIGTRFVRSVADAHGGLVGVESEPGKGARFWLKLPLQTEISGESFP